jgi:WD40 repeat protein/energy-coupling factor transporter ATP-binding protein EcfA2
MSESPDPADHEQIKQRARRGLREAVVGAAERLRGAAYPVAMGVLCAGACAPVAAAALGAGITATAFVGVIGGLGGGFLNEIVGKAVRQLHQDAGEDEVREAIEAEVAAVFASETEGTKRLELAIDAMAAEIQALPVVITALVEAGQRDALVRVSAHVEQLYVNVGRIDAHLYDQDADLRKIKDAARSIDGDVREIKDRARAGEERTRNVEAIVKAILDFLRGRYGEDLFDTASLRWKDNPYLGLQPFESRHAPIFFGRERRTKELREQAAERVRQGGVLVVTGASGAGKSSLLQAGLVPAIAQGQLGIDGSESWPLRVLRPGSDPLGALARKIAEVGHRDPNELRESLESDPSGFRLQVETAVGTARNGDGSARLILVVDQFEEVFSETVDAPQRHAFITALDALAAGPVPIALVVLGMRGEFVGRCAEFPELQSALQQLYVVGPATATELRQTIVGPADAAGVRIEVGLVDDLLAEVPGADGKQGYGSGALPLLSEAMRRLWDESEDKRSLTRKAYEQSGGLADAISDTAEQAFASLGQQQRLAEALFIYLTEVHDDGVRRRQVPRAKLRTVIGEDVDPVIDLFVDKRLLVIRDAAIAFGGDESDDDGDGYRVVTEATIEIAHDFLFTQWERLNDWIRSERDSQVRRSKLVNDANEWSDRDEDPVYLYSGTKLDEVERERQEVWTKNRERFPVGDLEGRFLRESRSRDTRRKRARNAVITILAGTVSIAMVMLVLAYNANGQLTDERNRALSQQLAEESAALRGVDGALSQLLAATAWRLDETDAAFTALVQAVGDQSAGHLTGVGAVGLMEFSPDGSLLVTRAFGGLALWRTDTWTFEVFAVQDGFQSEQNDVVFSPDGSRLAVATDSGITLWNLNPLEPESTLSEQETTDHVAFSPDGSILAYALNDHVRLWDLHTGAEVGRIPTTGTALEFSADGTSLFVGIWGADLTNALQEWDLESPELLVEHSLDGYAPDWIQVSAADPSRLVACGSDTCFSLDDRSAAEPLIDPQAGSPMAISSDGTKIAGEAAAGGIVVWDADTGEQIHRITAADTTSAFSMAFQPGTAILAVGSASGIQLWDFDRIPLQSTVLASSNDDVSVDYASISGDGRRAMLFGAFHRTAIIGLPATVDDEPTVTVRDRTVWDGQISPDGTVAAGFVGERLEVGNIETGDPVAAMESDSFNFIELEFSPNGEVLAIGVNVPEHDAEAASAETNEIWLWDYGQDEIRTRITGMSSDVELSFSPDGKSLATSDYTGQVSVWNTEDGSLDARFDDVGVPHYLKFSGDGSRLAFDTPTGVSLLDLDSGEQQQLNTGPFLGDFGFSPGDRYITYPSDTGIRFWSLERDQLAAELSVGQYGASFGVFVPHSWQILVGDGQDVHLIDAGFLEDPYAVVCKQAGRDLTEKEWETYLEGFEFEEFEICP